MSLIHQGLGAFAQLPKGTTTPEHLPYQLAVEMLNSGQQLENFISRYCPDYLLAMTGYGKPVRINSKKGLKMAFALSSSVLITTDGTVLEGTDDKTSDTYQPGGSITSLSFAHAVPVKFGIRYGISFYGDDPYIAALHEIEHCRHLATIANEHNIAVGLLLPFEIDCEKVTDIVNPVFGQHKSINDGALALALARFPIIRTSSE